MNPVHTTPRRYDTIGLHLPAPFFSLKDIMISLGIRVGMASKDLNKGHSLRTVKMGDALETKHYSRYQYRDQKSRRVYRCDIRVHQHHHGK